MRDGSGIGLDHDVADVADVVATIARSPVVTLEPLPGGFTWSSCYLATLAGRADGRRVFVKSATNDETLAGNRTELAVLAGIENEHVPRLVGATDDGAVLVMEDLSDAAWSLAESDEEHAAIWRARATFDDADPPAGLSPFPPGPWDPWLPLVGDARVPSALAVGEDWWDRHGPTVRAAASAATTAGDRLVHGDLGPANWCRARRGWVIFDWAEARVGDPRIDLAVAGIRLRRDLGRPARVPLSDAGPLVALLAGFSVVELLTVDWTAAHPAARTAKAAEAGAGLAWAAELLGLPPLHLPHWA